jgi:hypothetical protein
MEIKKIKGRNQRITKEERMKVRNGSIYIIVSEFSVLRSP